MSPQPSIKPLNPNISGVQAAVDAGVAATTLAARVLMLDPEEGIPGIPVALGADGNVRVLAEVLKARDERGALPRRRTGEHAVFELDSFIALVNRWKDVGSVVFANGTTLRGVLNYHQPGGEEGRRWGDHRVLYIPRPAPEWTTWTANDGKALDQEAFGQFIDDNLADLVALDTTTGALEDSFASPAAVLQMARNLVVRTRGEFTRTINPTTGEGALVQKTEHEASSTRIPRAFLIGIPVLEGGERYRIEVRMRFELRDGKARFTYALYRRAAIEREVALAMRARVAEQTGLPVFAGAP